VAGWIASALFVAFIIGLTVIFASMPPEVAFGVPTALKVRLWLPIVAVPFVAVNVVSSFYAWRGAWWTLARRIHFTLVAVGGVVFLVWLNAWNLLGFHRP
jgi:hypothetical protein